MNRIVTLDYLRGIAMVMVVMGHILLFSLQLSPTPLMRLIEICEMPLFFIVSGFLAYKPQERIELYDEVKRFAKRSLALLIPMFVWSFLRNFVYGNLFCSFSIFYWGGYWFFYTLWWCCILSTACHLISSKLKFGLWKDVVLFASPIIIVFILKLKEIEIDYSPIRELTSFYPFYVLGYFMKKYPEIYKSVLNHRLYLPALVVFIINWISPFEQKISVILMDYAGSISAVIVLWMSTTGIKPESMIGKTLSMIGRNTLPIYAVHFLVISSLPSCLAEIVDVNRGFVLQCSVSLIYAGVIIALCLLVDRILGYDRWSRLLFFGELKKRHLTTC